MNNYRLISLLFIALTAGLAATPAHATDLRWCGDATGGAPYIFPDEHDPNRLIGFEIDLMEALGKRLGMKPQMVQIQWDQLVPALGRGNCDVVVNGLEITEDRKRVIDFSVPYFVFTEQITIRKGDSYRELEDLAGHRVGTLSASLAESMLKEDPRITSIAYPSAVEAYRDLDVGRVDAVLMDDIIAAWYAGPNPRLENVPQTLGESFYGMAFRKESTDLRQKIDNELRDMIRTGELEKIYRPWKLWSPAQKKLQHGEPAVGETREVVKNWTAFIPLLLKGAVMTLVLSLASMILAVLGGGFLCYGRLFGGRFLRAFCNGYIEIIRGTPLLIQLFLLYYGLPNLGIQLNAFTAAILGMGLNYAAYESEIYRAAYSAIPRGQMDAARSLGMTLHQSLRYILVPQAFRTALPPSTNDFIALFKDTSLVSVITVSELTRAYTTASTTTYRFLELGLVTAALYFAMSFPLSLWSRALERRGHAAIH